MGDVAIRAKNLGKLYRIGKKRERYNTLRDALAEAASVPFRWFQGNGNGNAPEETIWALKDVSFEIKQGEVVGIIGRNGAGKSTLLKILSRITEPTEGLAEIHGRVGSLLEVATGFHPELTGRDNIYLNGAILGMKKAEINHKFDEIVAFAEVENFIDTPVKHFSSGMYMRLAFAVAAHMQPEILLVDEVLAVGDAEFQKKCLGKIGEVAKEGRTVFFVSHNMAAIQSFCTEAILLDQGLIVSRGKTISVVEDYLKMVTRQDLSSSSDLSSVPRESGMKRIFVEGYVNGNRLVGQHTFSLEEDLKFELVLGLPEPMGQCTMGIHFEDQMGTRVYAVNSRWELKHIPLNSGRHIVECLIRTIPLVPGRYYISIGFTSGDHQVDWLERVSCIEFAERDIYGTGELPWAGQGYFLSRANWTISKL
jgi:homopolymeric O-antigen transport system ATP-binding protein